MTLDYLIPIDASTPRFADLFDELPLWSAPFGLRLLERVPVRAGMTILDVGAGTGFLSLELAQRFGPRTKIIAVDPWKGAMVRLREKLDRLSLCNVQLEQTDVLNLELPEASCDLILSNLGVNNFDNKEDVFRKLHRIARADAKLCITTNIEGHFQEFYDVFESALVALDLSIEPLRTHIDNRGNESSLRTKLSAAGFSVTHLDVEHFDMRFSDGSAFLRHHLIRLGFIDDWRQLVPVQRAEEVFNLLEQRMNEYAKEHGDWTVSIPLAYIESVKSPIPK